MHLSAEGRKLQARMEGGIVWDNHGCLPLRPQDDSFLPELEKCRAAGIDVVTLNIGFGDDGIEQHVRMAAQLRDWIACRSDSYKLVLSVADLAEAKIAGQLGICFDIEGMNALGNQLSMIRLYYDIGVRWMLVAYNVANAAGGGCLEEDRGLTPFGRAVIAEMNSVGMLLCCTHTGYRTAREAIELSKNPVIFSHSNPRAIWDHPRNIPDDLIKACASRGGVIGLNGFGGFLGDNDDRIETFVAHAEHLLDVAGEDHVGIGLDYVYDRTELADLMVTRPHLLPLDAYPAEPKMIPPWRLPEIGEALAARGHSNMVIAKILGGNMARVAAEVWR